MKTNSHYSTTTLSITSKVSLFIVSCFVILNCSTASAEPLTGIEALPRMLRVDLIWEHNGDATHYEVARSESIDGPFKVLPNPLPSLFIFTDYIGQPDKTYFYRIRRIENANQSSPSQWSETVSATTLPYDRYGFLTEVQEACFRYFYNFSHPISNLPREGIKRVNSWSSDTISGVSTGMYFFNMAVGIERGFVSREVAVEHVTTALDFLIEKADRFHGAFPHWLNGETGAVIPFSTNDNGADIVETAILAKGLIFAREYFDEDTPNETHIREIADNLWRTIEWNKFINEGALAWHWSPNAGFSKLSIVGFNEAEIAYILGVGSPLHSIGPELYWNGWMNKNPNYFNTRLVAGVDSTIELQLGKDYGMPMFLMHYSYMGLNPKIIPTPNGTLFEEFEKLTLANHDYCKLNAGRFAGYTNMWGLTASLDPDGYKAHEPMHVDNGTISPTATLASMPYQPELVMDMMEAAYLNYGKMLWGPFGFYDAFNFSRNWVADGYIGIDVGPIGPMIENCRSNSLWDEFMQAPEIKSALELIWGKSDDSISQETIPNEAASDELASEALKSDDSTSGEPMLEALKSEDSTED